MSFSDFFAGGSLLRPSRAAALWVAILVALVMSPALGAQPAIGVPSDSIRLVDVRVEGELAPFRTDEVQELLRGRPNRRFLGIPGVTPSLWLYQIGSDGSVVGRALQRAGEPPAWLDEDLAETDRERLQALYRQAGFLDARVHLAIEYLDADRARMVFHVDRGTPSRMRRVTYRGLEALTVLELRQIIARSELALEPGRAIDTTHSASPNQRLSESELLLERRRLLGDLRELGFALLTRDSIRAVAFPVEEIEEGRPTFDVLLDIRTGPRMAFGDVRMRVSGPEDAPIRTDTIPYGDGRMIVSIDGDRRLRPSLLRRATRFEPGEVYRESDLLATRRRLDATGVFSFSEVVPLPGEIAGPTAGDSLARLPHRVVLRTRPRHAIRLEGFVLQRTGVLGGDGAPLAGEELGLGAGVTYRNANSFGAGEQFTAGVSASVAGDFVEFPTAQIEGTLGMTLPYLAWPFGGLDRTLRPFDARTRFTLGALTARRDELRLLIRGRGTAGMRLEVQHNPRLTSLLDVVDFRLSDPDTLRGFQEQFLDLIEDPIARQFVLEDYTRPQINNALRYTLRSMTADVLRRDRGHSREVSIEAGGNLPYLLDRYVFTPGEVEGSIPGIPLFGGSGRLEYRQYVRAAADIREYVRLSRISVLAARASAGIVHPVGEAPVAPFDRRFYAGGAGSVRGWELRQLGPGRVPPEASAFVQGGDIRLELSAEARHILFRRLFAADWQAAAFVDAGNVWFGPRNPGDPSGRFTFERFAGEIAVGGGVGVRALWDFLILRLDFAWKVHSPVSGTPLFPEGNRPRIHFGIGQAF